MEYLPDFRLHRPSTVEAAVALRAGDPSARYLAGGTDMVVNTRRGIERPSALIDLTAIAALGQITSGAAGTRIGAAVTLAALAADRDLQRDYAAVADALGVRPTTLPITPDRLLKMIETHHGRAARAAAD